MDVHNYTMSDGSKPSYIIPLDSIDLNLLPKLSSWRKDATVPLWTAPSSSGVEYYEFEVLVSDEDNDEEQYEDVPSQHCFVCQAEVPRAYWKEHISSVRHKACSDIAVTSLDRAKKQMLMAAEPCSPREGSYFCPTCSATISSTKRSIHEQSEQHLQSALYEGLINSLNKLYQNQNNLTQVCQEMSTILTAPKDVQKQENCSKIDSKIERNISDVNLKRNVQNLDTDLNAKTDDANILIEAESGEKLLVTYENYHGLYTVGDNTQCRVCRTLVDNILEHVKGIEHKKKTDGTKIKDRNCIRQLNHLLNHCILCNEIIENPEAHMLCSENHITLLHKALVKDDSKVDYTKETMAANFIQEVTFNKNMYYCKVCQIYFSKSVLSEHIANQAHTNCFESLSNKKKNVLKQEHFQSGYCSICEVYVGQDRKAEKRHRISKEHRYKVWLSRKDNLIHYHMNQTNLINQVLCKVCDMHVNVDSINKHLNGDHHQTKYQTLLHNNYMKKSNDIYIFCSLCKRTELILDEMNHIKQRTHRKLMVKLSTVLDMKQTNKGNSKNKELDITELALKHSVEKHSEKYYHCKVCYEYITEDTILDHIISNKHRKYSKRIQNSQASIANNMNQGTSKKVADSANSDKSYYKATAGTSSGNQSVEANPVYDNLLNLDAMKPTKGIHYLFKLMYGKRDEVQCMPCVVKMHWDGMGLHRKSKPHKELYQNLLNSNTMFRIKHRSFCECCRAIMKINCEYIHLNGPLHRHNLKQNTERLDEVTLKDLSMKMFTEDIEAEKKRKQNAKWDVISDPESVDDRDEDLCDHTKISNSQNWSNDKQEHSDDEASISDTKDSFFSAAYTVTETKSQESTAESIDFKHYDVKDTMDARKELQNNEVFPKYSQHLFDKTENLKEVFCKICHLYVPYINDQILEHINGTKHSSKYKVLLQSNDLQERCDDVAPGTKRYHCRACPEDFGQAALFEHIHSEKHTIIRNSQQLKDPKVDSQSNSSKDVKENYKLHESKGNVSSLNSNSSGVSKGTNVDKDNTVWWTCMVCNIKLNSSQQLEMHESGINHKNNLVTQQTKVQAKPKVENKVPVAKSEKNSQIKKNYTKNIYDDVKNGFCNVCKVKVPGKINDIDIHVHGSAHTKNLKTILSNNLLQKTDFSSGGTNVTEPQTSGTTTKYIENGFCNVCKVNVPQHPNNMQEHLNGNFHKQNVKLNLSRNLSLSNCHKNEPAITTTTGEKFKAKSNIENKLANSQDHLKTVVPLPETSTKTHDVENGFCKVCKEQVSHDLKKIIEHLEGPIHNRNVKLNTGKNNLNEVASTSKAFKKQINNTVYTDSLSKPASKSFCECKVCNITIEDTPQSIYKHHKSEDHVKNVAKEKDAQPSNKSNSLGKEVNITNNTTKVDASPVVEQANIIVCSICKVNLTNNPNNMKEHVKGAKHKENIKRQQTERKTDDENQVDPLAIIEPKNNVFKQLPDTKMISMRRPDVVQDNECAQNILIDHPLLDYVTSMCDNNVYKCKQVERKTEDKVDAPAIVQLGNDYMCPVCEVNVPNNPNNIKGHIDGAKQQPDIEITSIHIPDEVQNNECAQYILIDHHLLEYVTRMCDINVNEQQLERKTDDKDKVDALAIVKLGNDYMCPVCEVNVPNNPNNIKGHNYGAKHKKNVMKEQLDIEMKPKHIPNVVQDNECAQNILTDHHLLGYVTRMCDIKAQTTNSTLEQSDSVSGVEKIDSTGTNFNEITKKVQVSATQNVLIDDHFLKYINRIYDIKTQTTSNTIKNSAILDTNRSAEYNKKEIVAIECEHISEVRVDGASVSSVKKIDNANTKVDEVTNKTQVDAKGQDSNASVLVEKEITNVDTNSVKPNNAPNCGEPDKNRNNNNSKTKDSMIDDKDTGFYICSLCERLIENNPTDIKSHLNSFHHNTKVAEKLLKEKEGKILKTESHFCDTCNMDVPKNAFAIKKHMDSTLHATKFESLLHRNKIKIRDNIICYCEVCDLYFSKSSMPTHIKKTKHKLLLKQSQCSEKP